MRRKSNSRNLFWPSLAATAVILVLLSASQLQDWLGMQTSSPPVSVSSSKSRQARPTALPLPTPISLQDSTAPRIAHDLASPTDSRSIDAATTRSVEVDTRAMLVQPLPSEPSPVATLMAPVIDIDQELAGRTPDSRHTVDTGFNAGRTMARPASAPANSDATALSATVAESSDRSANDRLGITLEINDGDHALSLVAPVQDGYEDSATGEQLTEQLTEQQDVATADDLEGNRSIDQHSGRSPSDSKPAGIAWPRTPALENDLKQLQDLASGAAIDAAYDSLNEWIQNVRLALLELQSIPSITDSRAGVVIAKLRKLADQGIAMGEGEVKDRIVQAKTLRTAHALLRRTVVWNAVWSVGEQTTGQVVSLRLRDVDSPLPAVAELRTRVTQTGDPDGWSRFLLLSDITSAAQTSNADGRRIVAQRLLSRINWDGLSQAHREWLNDDSVHLLTSRIRPWADAPVDYASLLAQLERQESDALDLGSIDLATAVQNLRFSENHRASDVANAINDYYRNANLRMAVSADFLRQLLPEVPAKATNIRQTLVGMPVRGSGIINSQLGLQLIPTEGAWNLLLNANGAISAQTGTSQWPVQIRNRSNTRFSAATPILIDNHSLKIGDTQVSVASNVKLHSMNTEFDGFPVIESLVRAVAMSRYQETAPLAKRQSETLTQHQISQQVSEELELEINKASDQLATRLLGPLGRLQLDPLVVDLDTTDARLTARYRVAGDWQLAAFTPRPRALSNSVLSMQIHQSLLNNTFEQLLTSDAPQPIRDMMGRVLSIFGVDPSRLPGELPENVHIHFASTRPITVEIEDGLLWLTLRIVKLYDNEALDLNYFVVRAAFRPEFDGLNAKLVRDGVVQISGPRMGIRERLPVRAIFTKVLADERPLPLVSEDLAVHPATKGLKVGMLELVDGWLCLAICPDEPSGSASAVMAKGDRSNSTLTPLR